MTVYWLFFASLGLRTMMVLQQKEQILQNSSPRSTIVLPVRLVNHSFYGECTYL